MKQRKDDLNEVMDGKPIAAVSLSEDDVEKWIESDCSFCCLNEKSVSSSSWTNVSQSEDESSKKRSVTENDCLRKEMINALAWATCKAFMYRPSDPLHYLAHQLSRWRYGDVSYKISNESNRCEDTCAGKSTKDTL